MATKCSTKGKTKCVQIRPVRRWNEKSAARVVANVSLTGDNDLLMANLVHVFGMREFLCVTGKVLSWFGNAWIVGLVGLMVANIRWLIALYGLYRTSKLAKSAKVVIDLIKIWTIRIGWEFEIPYAATKTAATIGAFLALFESVIILGFSYFTFLVNHGKGIGEYLETICKIEPTIDIKGQYLSYDDMLDSLKDLWNQSVQVQERYESYKK